METDTLIALLLNLEGTVEQAHFNRKAYKVKRIFATIDQREGTIQIKLTPEEQAIFCAYDKENILPVPNKWGEQGWTICRHTSLHEHLLHDMIYSAYLLAK